MDCTASSLQIITFVTSLARQTKAVLDASKALSEFEKDTRIMYQSINTTLELIPGIISSIKSINDQHGSTPLADIGILLTQLEQHRTNSEELEKCLQERRVKVSSWIGRAWCSIDAVLSPREQTDLDKCWERYKTTKDVFFLIYQKLSLLQAQTIGGKLVVTNRKLDDIKELTLTQSQFFKAPRSQEQPAVSLNRQKLLFKVPYSRNPNFTGRKDILTQISRCLLPTSAAAIQNPESPPAEEGAGELDNSVSEGGGVKDGRIFVLSGLPGMGKTSSAIEFCYQHQKDFPYIFWVAADTPQKLEEGYVAIAKALRLTSSVVVQDRDNVIQMARDWLQGVEGQHQGPENHSSILPPTLPWLLVLDNVDDFEMLHSSWPDFKRGAVLITSRDKMSVDAISSQSTQMTSMTPAEGGALLKKWLASYEWPGRLKQKNGQPLPLDTEQAEAWATEMQCYPLYMEQIAHFAGAEGISPNDLLRASGNLKSGVEFLARTKPSWNPRYHQSVADALASSMAKLDEKSRQLLATLALFDPDKIPEELLVSKDGLVPALSNRVSSIHALETLSLRSFVHRGQEDVEVGAYEENFAHWSHGKYVFMHRLVRDVALQEAPLPQSAFEDATSLLRKAFPLHGLARDHMVEHWETCEMYLPHVLSLHKHFLELKGKHRLAGVLSSASSLMDFAELMYSCAWYLCERGRFAIGKTLLKTAYDAYQGLQELVRPGPSGVPERLPSFADVTLFLSDLYTAQLFIRIESGDGDVGIPSTAGLSLVDLAKKALHIREDAVKDGFLDADHPNLANGYMNVGVFLAGKGDSLGAIEMHETALHIRQRTDKYKSEQHHGLALNYLNIGRCWWMEKKSHQASACFSKCIALMQERETVTKKRYPLTSWAKQALALVRIDEGKLEDALELSSASQDLHRETLGEKHMKTLSCSYRLAWILHKSGEFCESRKLLKFCLDAYCAMPSAPRAEIARTKFKLAQVEEDWGQEGSQHELFRREAHKLIVEIKGSVMMGREATEEDFDSEIRYFLR